MGAENILLRRRYIFVKDFQINPDEHNNAYLNAYLLINFGIEIKNKEYVTEDVLRVIDSLFDLKIPSSFYNNPQDMSYFTSDELFFEQVISYFVGYGTDIKRIELFKKHLPQYVVGDEVVLRTYTIVGEKEAKSILEDITREYCSYKRPLSLFESGEFVWLARNHYLKNDMYISCKDNIFLVLQFYPKRAKDLDKKDVVKFSISLIGELDKGVERAFFEDDFQKNAVILRNAIDNCKDCPLSKKQAKYFNKIVKVIYGKKGKESNEKSIYRLANNLIKEGKVYDAAILLNENGSLLLRNIKYLISRSNDEDIKKIIDLIKDDNVAILFQLLVTIDDDKYGIPRCFNYVINKRIVSYVEDEYETTYRKSALSNDKKALVKNILIEKIENHYRKVEKIGKIYISDEFEKVALPINTAANGVGIDVLPSGSRIPFEGKYIRTFCYWNGPRDLDTSLMVFSEEEMDKKTFDYSKNLVNWQNIYLKPYGDDILTSGDDTSTNGAEFQDLNIDELINKHGVRYVFMCVNGFGSDLSNGQIRAGIQIKNNIKTTAWDPKNIKFQIDVKGDCRAFNCFALDLKEKEIVVVNLMSIGGQIMSYSQVRIASRYVSKSFLEFNMKRLLSLCGEVVDDPKDAEIVFDSEYHPNENQKVVRPFDVSTLVSIVNK